MKRTPAVVSVAATLILLASGSLAVRQTHAPEPEHGNVELTTKSSCGVELWAKKLMRDPDVGKVQMNPVPTTVDALRALSVPRAPTAARIAPEELQVYRVQVRLVKAALEADSDFHLVVADPTDGATMIAEIPDAARCGQGTAPDLVARMEVTRAAFIARFGTPGPSTAGFMPLSGNATITGPAFVDTIHGQTGVAPNGMEIHPILDIELSP